MIKKIPFTSEGLAILQSECKSLENKRPAALEDLKSAREKGDLSENMAYRAARSKLSSIDRRIRTLKSLIDRAYVVTNKNIDKVDIGTYVTIADDKGGEQIFQIVDTHEADINRGKISSYSPLGKALFGKRLNDKITVFTPSGSRNYIIKNVFLR